MAKDGHTSISNAVMKKGDGGFQFEGEFIKCEGGGDTALVYEDRLKTQRAIFDTMTARCDRMVRQLSRYSSNFGEDAGHNGTTK